MSDSVLQSQIDDDIKTAMKAKQSEQLTTLRMLKAAIKQREIDQRTPQTDTDILSVVEKMIKQRRESAQQYIEAKRQELADKENNEINILQRYLPEQLDNSAIEQAVKQAIQSTQATSMKDMGAVMAILKPQLQGQADMGQVSKKVRAMLSA